MNPRLAAAARTAMLVLPPAALVVGFWDTVRAHPVGVALAALAYGLVAALVRDLRRVADGLRERWIERVIERSDAALVRRLTRYRSQYLHLVSRMHHDMDLRGLATRGDHALAMEQVFVGLRLVPRPPQATVGNMLATGVPISAQGQRQIWEALAEPGRRPLAVIGAPGGGKTTLLKYVAYRLAQPSGRPAPLRRTIPVLLFLREHAATIVADGDVSVADLVAGQLARLNAPEPTGWFEAQLQAGRCLVMLDGLDEIADREHRALVVQWVERQLIRHGLCRFVVTSRPFGYRDNMINSATVLQVLEFSDGQVEQFVRAWYLATLAASKDRLDVVVRAEATRDAEDLLGRLRAAPSLFALTASPLLLTMVAYVHLYRDALPGSRYELYRQICEVLLDKRQAAKGLAGSGMKGHQREYVLQALAYAMMSRRLRDVSAAEAAELVRDALSQIDPAIEPEHFLAEIEHGGLLVEPDTGTYAFAHLTFQEYLAARWIRERSLVGELITRIQDDWWRETTLLYVAQVDADAIVSACLDADAADARALALAADCADEARNISPALRARLDAELSFQARADPQRRRLIADVLIMRKLRDVARTRQGTQLCAVPVSHLEYSFFLEDMADGDEFRWPAHWLLRPHQEGGRDPVAGLLREDVGEFVAWARAGGIPVRLPTLDELDEEVFSRIARDDRWCAWTRDSDGLPMLAGTAVPAEGAYGVADVVRDWRELFTVGGETEPDLVDGPDGSLDVALTEVYLAAADALSRPATTGPMRRVMADLAPRSTAEGDGRWATAHPDALTICFARLSAALAGVTLDPAGQAALAAVAAARPVLTGRNGRGREAAGEFRRALPATRLALVRLMWSLAESPTSPAAGHEACVTLVRSLVRVEDLAAGKQQPELLLLVRE